jgi:SAM-dependent methyltransferase
VDGVTRQDIDFHARTAEAYDADVTAVYGIYHRAYLGRFLDEMRATHGPVDVLDLGSGTGVVALALAERGFRARGIDHSPEMVEIARGKARAAGREDEVTFEIGDVRATGEPDGAFGGVTCQGTLHHLEDMEGCVRELERVLRPGGFFFISEPCQGRSPAGRAWDALVGGARALAHRVRGRRPSPSPGLAPGEAPISADALRATLDALGLDYEVEYVTHLQLLERVLPDGARLAVTRAVSAPWRRRRGDLLFVYGSKPAR